MCVSDVCVSLCVGIRVQFSLPRSLLFSRALSERGGRGRKSLSLPCLSLWGVCVCVRARVYVCACVYVRVFVYECLCWGGLLFVLASQKTVLPWQPTTSEGVKGGLHNLFKHTLGFSWKLVTSSTLCALLGWPFPR
jgi:hypothetical protein